MSDNSRYEETAAMNTAKLQSVQSLISSILRSVLIGLTAAAVLADFSTTSAADDFQQNALFNPSGALLKAEALGHVTIYDGLDNEVVEHALDEQFGRIENMMFTRIRRPQPDGEIIEDDDGC
ncbi:MAG: hypothetical protein ACWGNB_04660 [Thiogranum sp.]